MAKVEYPESARMLSRAKAKGSVSQQAIAEWCGVGQPAVHKWLHGYARPRPSHLAILAVRLKLDPAELAQAAGYEAMEIEKFESSYSSHFTEMVFLDFIGSEERMVALTHQLSITGDPGSAIEILDGQIGRSAEVRREKLKKTLQRYPLAKHRRDILEVHSRSLHELGRAICISRPPLEAWDLVLELKKEQDQIREMTGDNAPLGRACYSLGDAYYGLKQYDPSREYFSQALEYIKDEHWQLEVRRLLACNAAHRGDKKAAEEEGGEIQRLLGRGQIPTNWVVISLEGLGRSQLLTGRSEGWKWLKQAESMIIKAKEQGKKVAFLELQYDRTRILGVKHLEPGDKERIQQLGEQGLQRANTHGFGESKYALVFQDALEYDFARARPSK